MARVATNPVGLHRFQPCFRTSQALHQSVTVKPNFHLQNKSRRWQIVACQTTPNPTESSALVSVIHSLPSYLTAFSFLFSNVCEIWDLSFLGFVPVIAMFGILQF